MNMTHDLGLRIANVICKIRCLIYAIAQVYIPTRKTIFETMSHK